MRKTTTYIALGLMCSMLLGGCSLGKEQGDTKNKESETKTETSGSVEKKGKASADVVVESTQTREAETVQESEHLIQTISVTATGDCSLGKLEEHEYGNSFDWYYDQKGSDYFFKGVKKLFEEDDCTLINLECVLSDSTEQMDKQYSIKGKPSYTSILTGSSVEACSLGNNHSMDYGYQSLVDTQDNLTKAGVAYGYNEHAGIITTKDGLKVGVVSSSLLSKCLEVEAYLKDGIKQLKSQNVDLIVACCHWGIEKEYYPEDYQKRMAHELIDCGADLVIGNHPHVLQGIELYNNKVICYSLGNFCFGGNRDPQDKNTMVYQQKFTYVDGQLQECVDAQIIPCTLSSAPNYNDFQPTIVTGDKKQEIIDKVNGYSANYSNIKFDSNGKMTVSE